MESLDQRGEWWVPGGRYDSIQGSLEFTPTDGARLDFTDPLSLPNEWNGRIFGIADGEKYTLCDCQTLPSEVILSAGPTEAIPQTILVGEHLSQKQLYSKVSVDFSNLELWACDELCQTYEAGDTETYEFDTSTTTLAKTEHDNNQLSLNSRGSVKIRPCEKIEKQNEAFFLVESEPSEYDSFSKYILELQRLVSLGFNEPVHPRNIYAWTDDESHSASTKVKILQNLSHYQKVDPSLSSAYFTSMDVDLGLVVERWFENLEESKILHNLYFGTIYNDGMFEENRLLSFVSAIESYHDRVLFPNDTTIPESEFKGIKNGMQELVAGTGLEKRMNGLIKNVINDVGIRDKIEKFLLCQETTYEALSEKPGYSHREVIEDVAKNAAGARHSVAHGSSELGEDIIGIGGVPDWLQLGIEACLLSKVGIEQDQIVDRLRSNYHLRLDKVEPPRFDKPEL